MSGRLSMNWWGRRAVGRAGEFPAVGSLAASSAVKRRWSLGARAWLNLFALLIVGGFWLLNLPPAAPGVDLSLRWIRFESMEAWGSAMTGCTVGPRVRIVARVKNLGTEPSEDGAARVRFVGKPAGGADTDVFTFEAPIRSIGASYFTNDVKDGPALTLPDAFLDGPSTWTATVIHPDDVYARNDTVVGKVLTPCSRR
jgi:hypothetical protein